MRYDTVLDLIGDTPVLRLQALSRETGLEVHAKIESCNPGGSHKVRVAQGMVMAAEARGILTPGSGQTILEPSGGNTGLGLAIMANLRGYRLVLVIPDNYSPEKQRLLKLYGAQVVLSDSRLGNNSHGEKAFELLLENPDFVMLNQQRNPANPESHRRATAQEILRDFPEGLDAFVSGIGTGGHITGISEILKARFPEMVVHGVEPEECDLLADRHAEHGIQGLSIGLVPEVLNLSVLDGMIKVARSDCVAMAQEVLRTEAIGMGISSAANLVAIRKLAPHLRPGARVLTMVYDGIESYLDCFSPREEAMSCMSTV